MQFQLHFVLPPQSLNTREQIIDWCVVNTPETETGFAGWDSREFLKEFTSNDIIEGVESFVVVLVYNSLQCRDL